MPSERTFESEMKALEEELAEGYITVKGFEKKRLLLQKSFKIMEDQMLSEVASNIVEGEKSVNEKGTESNLEEKDSLTHPNLEQSDQAENVLADVKSKTARRSRFVTFY